MGAPPRPPLTGSCSWRRRRTAWSSHLPGGLGPRRGNLPQGLQVGDDPAGQLLDLLLVFAVGLAEGQQQAGKTGQAAPVLRGKIGAAIKRLQLRGEKDAQGPAAPADEGGDHVHVSLVQFGALFPIHLDGDEVFVQDRGNGCHPRNIHGP